MFRGSLLGAAWASWTALLLSACLGGQTGTEERAGAGTPVRSDHGCVSKSSEVGLDEISPLGFSAREALRVALGTHRVGLVWSAPQPSFSFGPEMGEGTLSLAVSSAATGARFVHRELEPGAVALAGVCPPDEIEVDVTVLLETGSGALSEQFPVTLRAVSSSSLRFAVNLPLEGLAGSFYVTTPTGLSTDALSIGVEFDAQGVRGALSGVFEQRQGDLVSGGSRIYACFPAGAPSCPTP